MSNLLLWFLFQLLKVRKIRGKNSWIKLVKTSDEFVIYFAHLIPSWLVWSKIKLIVHVALPKRRIKQFKPVQQSRQQALWAYCPNIYTVIKGDQWLVAIWNTPMIQFQPTKLIRISTGKLLAESFYSVKYGLSENCWFLVCCFFSVI